MTCYPVAVFLVDSAIPALGAEPGDELVIRPADPDRPFVLYRQLPRSALTALPTDLTLLYADGLDPARLVSAPPARVPRLSLVKGGAQ